MKQENSDNKKRVKDEPILEDEQLLDEMQEQCDDDNAQASETLSEEEDEVAQLREQLAEMKDNHLRLMAEYDNFRKRTLKEKSELIKTAGERILTHFLEVLDDFDLAVQNLSETTDVEGMAEGIDLIRTKFIAAMKSQGVNEIEVIGEPFNSDVFDAVGMIPVEDPEMKGKVVECLQKGYMLNDKVIRHPKVLVGQ